MSLTYENIIDIVIHDGWAHCSECGDSDGNPTVTYNEKGFPYWVRVTCECGTTENVSATFALAWIIKEAKRNSEVQA